MSTSDIKFTDYYLTAKGFLANSLNGMIYGRFSTQAKLATVLLLVLAYLFGFLSVVICFFSYRFYILIKSISLISSKNLTVDKLQKLINEWITFCIVTSLLQIIHIVLFEYLADLIILCGYYLLMTKYEIFVNIITNMMTRLYINNEVVCNDIMNNATFLASYLIHSIKSLYDLFVGLFKNKQLGDADKKKCDK